MSDEGIGKVAEALSKNEKNRYSESIRQKYQGEKAAKEVIARVVEVWTGHEVESVGQLPVVRDGKKVCELGSWASLALNGGGDPEGIAASIWLEDSSTIRARKKAFERLRKSLAETAQQLSGLSIEDRAQIFADDRSNVGNALNLKIIKCLGSYDSVFLSGHLMQHELSDAISRCKKELEGRKKSKGRPRVEARYRAAEGLAKIYAKVTGERPTYSQDQFGLYGKFTPALRELFDAMGWKSADLRAPAEHAISKITEEDFELPKNAFFGGISTLPVYSTGDE